MKDPKTCQMLVHIFGATSSPSVCGYAPKKTPRDNMEISPERLLTQLCEIFT